MVNKKGFSIVELMIVVAIAGIIAALGGAALGGCETCTEDAAIVTAENDARSKATGKYEPKVGSAPDCGFESEGNISCTWTTKSKKKLELECSSCGTNCRWDN